MPRIPERKLILEASIRELKKKRNLTREEVGFLRRKLPWSGRLGASYLPRVLHSFVKPTLMEMDARGLLGSVIVDAGSGRSDAEWIPLEGKKVIKLDIAFPKTNQPSGQVLEVPADVENVSVKGLTKKKRVLAAARFLGINPKEKRPQTDTILFMNILNYVDFRKTINGLSRYLKKGGRIVIFNSPLFRYAGAGVSRGMPRTNEMLVEFLKSGGFDIEHLDGWVDGKNNFFSKIGVHQIDRSLMEADDLRREEPGVGLSPAEVKNRKTIFLIARKK